MANEHATTVGVCTAIFRTINLISFFLLWNPAPDRRVPFRVLAHVSGERFRKDRGRAPETDSDPHIRQV